MRARASDFQFKTMADERLGYRHYRLNPSLLTVETLKDGTSNFYVLLEGKRLSLHLAM